MKDRKTPESYNWDKLSSDCFTDKTKVLFQGVPYYLRQRDQYYISALPPPQVLLHRAVWEFCNGPIPPMHHIHHIDHNRRNNHPSNLECMSLAEHTRHHAPHRQQQSSRSVKEDRLILNLYNQCHSTSKVANAASRSQAFVWKILNEYGIIMDGIGGTSAKLTDQQVSEIKVLLRKGSLKQQEIARRFNVGQGTISRINTDTYRPVFTDRAETTTRR